MKYHHMTKERQYITERKILWKQAQEIHDEMMQKLNIVFSQIANLDKKIDEQIIKQMKVSE